jgi:uracil-DNA glycosylase family 4
MRADAQEELLNLGKLTNWSNQNKLTIEEDKIAKRHWVFVTDALSDPVKRYLAVGSLPYMISQNPDRAEKLGKQMIEELWQDEWPMTEMVNTLIRRPHNPTGNLRATYMVIGDAPGVGSGAVFTRVERMFTRGPSSHLLRKALIAADLYYQTWFTNLVRNSTEHNRPTLSSEVNEYKLYLSKELQLINPRVVLLLGNHVTKMFDQYYSQERQRREVITIYHPSYVARMNWKPTDYAGMIMTRLGNEKTHN